MMRPRARPKGMMKKKKTAAPEKSIRPRARPEMIGNTPGSQGTRGIDPKENYSPEDFKRLTGGMKAGGMAKKGYKAGGKMPDLSGDGKVTQKDVLMGRGVVKKKAGGMLKKKGYAAGGMMKKGYKKGGKVRGAGIARKGVRAAKMV